MTITTATVIKSKATDHNLMLVFSQCGMNEPASGKKSDLDSDSLFIKFYNKESVPKAVSIHT